MASISPSASRVSTQMSSNLLLSNLRRTNVAMIRAQAELSSGLRVERPSDDPSAIGGITSLTKLLAEYDQRSENLSRASGLIDVTDQALGEVSDLLIEAQSIASSQIGIGSDAETRNNQAEVIDAMIDSLFEIANRKHNNIHLFGGRQSNVSPIVEQLGGYRFVGSRENLSDGFNTAYPVDINTSAASALSALSGRVQSSVDLDPGASAATRLDDVAGALGHGVTLGAVQLTVNAASVDVDLTGARTLGDVVDTINDAITTAAPGAGSLAVTADGFTLTAAGGNSITLADIGSGVTAQDLGLDITATSGATAGADLDPQLTELTALADLGATVSFAGGLKITNGTESQVVDFSAAATVQDLINAVARANLGVRLEINDAGTSLNLVNEISGTALSVGENAGGSTATDLGLRTFDATTLLSDFNDGLGVSVEDGVDDLRITLSDGTPIDVNLDGATTVADVIAAITTAAGAAPLPAALAADGNGLVLTDGSAGAGAFHVVALNGSHAAEDLGLNKNVGATPTITSDDHATVRVESAFTHLIALRDALRNDDDRGITLAAEGLKQDERQVAAVRASVGVRSQRVHDEITRIAERKLQTETLLSDLRDTDYADAVSRFALLEQQLQANLAAGARLQSLTLLDFLR